MGSQVIAEELRRLHERHAADERGALATYIPELANADPDWFGITLCTIDGSVHEAGDPRQEFTIQSVSKPFVFALALADNDVETVLARVGMEPSGDAFNSIVLDREDRPHNPMVNAGAIATVGLVRASSAAERFDRILATKSAFAGRNLEVDEAVYASERLTGHRNRAIGHLLRTVGALVDDVETFSTCTSDSVPSG
jgi:glutaminase